MGSNFIPTSYYPTESFNSTPLSIYTHNPYRYVTEYPPVFSAPANPCLCDACTRSSNPHHYYDELACSTPNAYSDVQSEPQQFDETTPELPSVPTEECSIIDEMDCPARYLFVGQLPFQFNDSKLNWLVREFGGASRIFSIEAIWKPNRITGEMQHKGCAHVLVPREEVQSIVNNLHHHILVHHDILMYGETRLVEFWAGRAFPQEARVASNALVCEGSARQIRKFH